MKFILSVLLTALLAAVAGMFLPWWSIAIAAFIVPLLIPQRLGLGFLAGFTAIFLLWGGLALVINMQNRGILAQKLAALFPLGGSAILLVLVTALIGGLVGGFAALTGSALRPPRRLRRRI